MCAHTWCVEAAPEEGYIGNEREIKTQKEQSDTAAITDHQIITLNFEK